VDKLPSRGVLVLENTRFAESRKTPSESRDEQEDLAFAKEIVDAVKPAAYVIDGFSVCHRNHASVTGIAHALRTRRDEGAAGPAAPIVAGYLLQDEIREVVNRLQVDRVQHPYVAVLGGAKVSGKGGKLKAIQGLVGVADAIVIGGAMLYPFLRAKGLNVGQEPRGRDPRSKQVKQDIEQAEKLLKGPGNFLIPTVVSGLVGDTVVPSVDVTQSCPPDFRMQDVDADNLTSMLLGLAKPATIAWNGPLGHFEEPPFRDGTKALLEYLVNTRREYGTRTVAGGGDTEAAIRDCYPGAELTHISTGGGAMLAALANQPLPGIDVLDIVLDGHG